MHNASPVHEHVHVAREFTLFIEHQGHEIRKRREHPLEQVSDGVPGLARDVRCFPADGVSQLETQIVAIEAKEASAMSGLEVAKQAADLQIRSGEALAAVLRDLPGEWIEPLALIGLSDAALAPFAGLPFRSRRAAREP